jgi:uncharacterized protein YbbC (DUF1343 family)
MSQLSRRFTAFVLALLVAAPLFAQRPVGVDAQRLALMDALIAQAVERKELPGATVLVGHRDRIVWRKSYGGRAVAPQREAMTPDTVFDVASLTKVVATATSIMLLVERGQVRLNDPVSRHLPELKGEGRDAMTVEHLLTHTAGYAPDFDLREKWTGYDEAMKRLAREPLRSAPGARFVYSDIGYIALGEIVRRVGGEPLDIFARHNIFEPLDMKDTGFRPAASLRPRIAPTEQKRGQAAYLGGDGQAANGDDWLRGEVHDPTSYRMGGVAGHAGLFSTADDLARYCRMILGGGALGGVRLLSPASVAEMTRPRAVNAEGAARALGWDVYTTFSNNRGDLFPRGTFGHTGFTGTSLWLDPTSATFTVFLSNRVHPDGKGDVGRLRGVVANLVATAVTDTPADEYRAAAARFAAEIAADALRWKDANPTLALEITDAQVLTGVDVLEKTKFKELQGLRVGLVTNHTGRNRAGRQTIDILANAPGVKLVALFSPEHGIRGALDEKVSDAKDEQTGLPIYSLYGETRRPKPEQLQDLDALVFDIQDIGARFYTYISTLGNVMEEAAKLRKPVFVLDRPNPINGLDVEGPVADADKLSFIAYHTIPVRHGMTVGELALLFNEQRKIGADVRVVKMEGWRRAMWLDSTNLTWVNPSPNMRSLTEATLYPGVGLLETTNLSVGRGTDTPFEIIGAPWLDGPQLARELNAKRLAGVRFVPLRFTPKASVFKDQECGGVNLVITNRAQFRPVRAGLEIAVTLRRLYPETWKADDYLRLLVNADALARLKRGDAAEDIARSWAAGLEAFRAARARVLLYN